MKKISILFAAALAALSFASCEKSEVADNSYKDIKVNIAVASPMGADTKAAKTDWAAGDKINIWFDTDMTKEPGLVLTYNGTEWENSEIASFVTLKASGYMKALYEGRNDWSAYEKDDMRPTYQFYRAMNTDNAYPISWYSKTNSSSSMSEVTYTPTATYTYADGVLTGAIPEWETSTIHQVVITGLTPVKASNYQLMCDKLWINTSYLLSDIEIKEAGATSGQYTGGYTTEEGMTFSFYLTDKPGTEADYLFTLKDTSTSSTKKTYYTATGKTLTNEQKITVIKIDYSKFN